MRSAPVALCFLLSGWCCYADSAVDGISVEAFHVVVSGGQEQASPGSPQGVSVLRDRFNVLEKGPRIPLLKGHGLAVTFVLTGEYRDLEHVRLVVTYPEMTAPNGEVFSRIDRTQESLVVDGTRMVAFSYAFDDEWEFVEGIWTVQIFAADSMLGEAQLVAYRPEKKSATAGSEVSTTDPIPERLGGLCAVVDLSKEDESFLENVANTGGPGECLARAILFRHSPTDFGEQFRHYFAIDHSVSPSVLVTDEINSRVNRVMKEFQGRHPAEVMARVYLGMRGKGLAAKKADGTELSLEVMFRASVFAAVSGGSKDEVLRLAGEADRR